MCRIGFTTCRTSRIGQDVRCAGQVVGLCILDCRMGRTGCRTCRIWFSMCRTVCKDKKDMPECRTFRTGGGNVWDILYNGRTVCRTNRIGHM